MMTVANTLSTYCMPGTALRPYCSLTSALSRKEWPREAP